MAFFEEQTLGQTHADTRRHSKWLEHPGEKRDSRNNYPRVINYPQGWERGIVEEFWTINVMERWYWCVQQRQHNRRQYRLLTEFGCVGSYWSIGSRCCCEKNKKEIYRDGWKKRNSAVEKQLDWEYGLPSVLRSTMDGRKKWLRRRFWRKRRAEAVDHQNQWQVKILKWGVKSVLLVCGNICLNNIYIYEQNLLLRDSDIRGHHPKSL